MSSSPQVAIIVPCFNDGAYIGETLDSVRTKVPHEIIVVDDGSTDAATVATLEHVALRPNVRVIRVENGGPGLARMAGVSATNAPLVLPLDADDALVEGGLEALVDALEEHPEAAFAFGDYVTFGSARGRWRTPSWNPWALTFANWWPVTSLFRRSTLVGAGGWQLHGYEDWDLLLALAERDAVGVHCDAVVYARRLHGGRVNIAARKQHAERYHAIRDRHRDLWGRRPALRRASGASLFQRIAYPLMLGDRRWFPIFLENRVIAARLWLGARRIRA